MSSVAGRECSCLLQCSLCAKLGIKDLLPVPQKGFEIKGVLTHSLKLKLLLRAGEGEFSNCGTTPSMK